MLALTDSNMGLSPAVEEEEEDVASGELNGEIGYPSRDSDSIAWLGQFLIWSAKQPSPYRCP